MAKPSVAPTVTRVAGVRVGHAASPDARSGVSVVRFDRATPVVAKVLGGASATFDTGSLSLDATFGRRWAIFLSGGSLFGLDAARGVRSAVLADGDGGHAFSRRRRLAPITGAALFDLPDDDRSLPDYAALGEAATRAASRRPVPPGAVGAGAGATVAKYRGRRFARRGGVGSAAARLPRLGWVGAFVAVNSVGGVWDARRHRWAAAATSPGGRQWAPLAAHFRVPLERAPRGTTLAVVVAEAALDRPALGRVAQIATAGFARSVRPVFTATDGDVLFVASTERRHLAPAGARPMAHADLVGTLAAELIADAVVGAVTGAGPAVR